MKHIFLGTMLMLSLAACNDAKKEETPIAAEPAVAAEVSAPKPVEFADSKYTGMANTMVAALVSKDIDGYISAFADNAIYQLNTGDSVIGKQAIAAMWKDSYEKRIDHMTLENPIYLPLIVNQPQGGIAPGTYLLSWYRLNGTFKSGKTTQQYVHVVSHFDNNDKIDRVTEYVDRTGFPKP